MSERILILGDILTIAMVTLVGFASHREAGSAFLPRMGAAFFPLILAWFLLAPWFSLFRDEVVHSAQQLWRPALTAVFAAPLAAVLRGFLLNAPVIPIFAAVLGITTALGITIWRGTYFILTRRL